MVATPLFKKKIKFWSPRRDPGCDTHETYSTHHHVQRPPLHHVAMPLHVALPCKSYTRCLPPPCIPFVIHATKETSGALPRATAHNPAMPSNFVATGGTIPSPFGSSERHPRHWDTDFAITSFRKCLAPITSTAHPKQPKTAPNRSEHRRFQCHCEP